jgi:hypothetical protein
MFRTWNSFIKEQVCTTYDGPELLLLSKSAACVLEKPLEL